MIICCFNSVNRIVQRLFPKYVNIFRSSMANKKGEKRVKPEVGANTNSKTMKWKFKG